VFNYYNGDRYEGEWKEDKKDGKGSVVYWIVGTYYYVNGDVHEGDWKNGVLEGHGRIKSKWCRNYKLCKWR